FPFHHLARLDVEGGGQGEGQVDIALRRRLFAAGGLDFGWVVHLAILVNKIDVDKRPGHFDSRLMRVKLPDPPPRLYHTRYLCAHFFGPVNRYRLFREKIWPKLLGRAFTEASCVLLRG